MQSWFPPAILRLALLVLFLSPLALAPACGGDDDGGGGGGGGGGGDAAPAADAGSECEVTGDDPLPFMCPCEVADDRCDTTAGDMCFNFNAKGPHCTRACSSPTDCPAPSGGCNNMGVCKAPD
jgi:hypothetical protein